MHTLVPAPAADSPSLLRSVLLACATVTLLALSLGALYLSSDPAAAPASSVAAKR